LSAAYSSKNTSKSTLSTKSSGLNFVILKAEKLRIWHLSTTGAGKSIWSQMTDRQDENCFWAYLPSKAKISLLVILSPLVVFAQILNITVLYHKRGLSSTRIFCRPFCCAFSKQNSRSFCQNFAPRNALWLTLLDFWSVMVYNA